MSPRSTVQSRQQVNSMIFGQSHQPGKCRLPDSQPDMQHNATSAVCPLQFLATVQRRGGTLRHVSLLLLILVGVAILAIGWLVQSLFLWFACRLLRVEGATVRRVGIVMLLITAINMVVFPIMIVAEQLAMKYQSGGTAVLMLLGLYTLGGPVICIMGMLRIKAGRALAAWLVGQYLVLGDNSARSKDSRLWGRNVHFLPAQHLIGRVSCTYAPLDRWRTFP